MDGRDEDDWFKQAKARWEEKKAGHKPTSEGEPAPTDWPAAEPVEQPATPAVEKPLLVRVKEEQRAVEDDLRQLANAQKAADDDKRAAEELAKPPLSIPIDGELPVLPRQRRWLLPAAGGAGLLLIVGVVSLWPRHKPLPEPVAPMPAAAPVVPAAPAPPAPPPAPPAPVVAPAVAAPAPAPAPHKKTTHKSKKTAISSHHKKPHSKH